MKAIVRLDNPIVYTAFGSVPPGGLGQFDPAIYQEIELPFIPDHWTQEIPVTVAQQLDNVFKTLSDGTRASFYGVKAAVKAALDTNDFVAAKLIIQNTIVPAELADEKQALLAVFA